MTGYLYAVALAAVTLTMIVSLLRRRRLREKYAGIWLVVSLIIIVLAAFPRLAVRLAELVGVETPSNLLFAAGLVVVLLVVVQLSTELSGLEEETRTVAERLAIVDHALEQLRAAHDAGGVLPNEPQQPTIGPNDSLRPELPPDA